MENNLEELLFRYRSHIAIAILGVILILLGIVIATRQLPFLNQDKVEVLSVGSDGGVENQGNKENMVVEISGAVERPGVLRFDREARVEDALIQAGGLSATADREWVAKFLNRAARLIDGQKIFIPDKSQSSNIKTQNYNSNVKSEEANASINVNTASQSQLESLAGVGPVTAKKIIEGRPYSTVGELLARKILGKKVYEENKDKLSIY